MSAQGTVVAGPWSNDAVVENLRALIVRMRSEDGGGRGWQSRVAKRLGINRSYVSRIWRERGDVQVGRQVVQRVCEATGVSPAELFETQNARTNDDAPMDLASKRYQSLVLQMADEVCRRRGWIRAVAGRLGVHETYISRIARFERANVGMIAIRLAIERVGIRREYFFERDLVEPKYKDFIVKLRQSPGPDISTADAEGAAIEALARLDAAARKRVLDYANARWP